MADLSLKNQIRIFMEKNEIPNFKTTMPINSFLLFIGLGDFKREQPVHIFVLI
jgi:hypothetical protein